MSLSIHSYLYIPPLTLFAQPAARGSSGTLRRSKAPLRSLRSTAILRLQVSAKHSSASRRMNL